MKRFILLILSLSLGLISFSQGFNYQAVIRNSEGEPLANQQVMVGIDLEDQSKGIVYYSEVHDITTSSLGIVNLIVGEGEVVDGSFGDVPWSSNSVFMRILVDLSGSGSDYAEIGVTKIMSVPYALFAESGNEGPQGEMGPQGPQGDSGNPGEPGTPGVDGASAYQIWLEQGNTGTEAIYLASLSGAEGAEGVGITETVDNEDGTFTFLFSNGTQFTTSNLTGSQGLQGIQGEAGLDGADGVDGPSAYEIWLAQPNEGTEADFLLSLIGEAGTDGVGIVNTIDNSDGTFTFEYSDGSSFTTSDLTGAQGPQGEIGPQGPQGIAGTGLNNRGQWVTGSTYNEGDYVFSISSTDPGINSMWIVQSELSFLSNTLPKDDLSNWVEFQAPQGEPGPVAEGTTGQTLRHDGTGWVASSVIYNSGTMIGIGNTTPTNILDITGSIRLRTGAAANRVLTSSSTGVASWQAPSYSNWGQSGDDIYNSNDGNVVIGIQKDTGIQSKLVVNQVLNPLSGNRIILGNLASDFRQYNTSDGYGAGIKFTVGNISSYTGTAAIVAERTGTYSQGKLHFAVNDAGASNKVDIPIAMTIDGPSGGNVGIGTIAPKSKLDVSGGDPTEEEPIFAVRNNDGLLVFGVYQSGVRIFVEDTPSKATKGGFAVGGLSDQTKANGTEYLRVTPDSVRITINTPVGGKATRGGFAVGGLSDQTKAPVIKNLLFIAPDSARIYTDSDLSKGTRGGFAVGGLSDQTKATDGLYMLLTPENYLIGQGAGKSISTGKYNSIMGYQAGEKLSTGKENIFIGYRAGAIGLTGDWNTFLGFEAGLSNTGSDNTFIGYKAGRANMNKGGNVYLGSKAGELATYGEQNVFIGESTGQKTTYGKKNVFIGYQSGLNNTGNVSIPDNGSYNVFLGNESGKSNTTGNSNVFIGNLSGYSNSTGGWNTFIGFEAGYNNKTSYNLFIGYQAGKANTFGSYNTFMGYQSGLANTTGDENAFIGYQTGFSNTEGIRNVFLGWKAGRANISGDYNIFIGREAGMLNTTGTSNVYVGESSGQSNVDGTGNTFIGKSAGGNQTSGGYNVYVGGQSAIYKTSGQGNVHIGWHSGAYSAGDNNVIIGYFAGMSTIGSGNVFIGKQAGQNASGWANRLIIENSLDQSTPLIYGEFDNNVLKFSAKVGVNSTNAEGYQLKVEDVVINNDNPAILGQHNVTTNYGVGVKGLGGWKGVEGINPSTSGSNYGIYGVANGSGTGTRFGVYGLASGGATNWAGYFSGNVYVSGTFSNPSDIVLKKNIKPLKNALITVAKINGVSYEWKSDDELKGIRKSDDKGEYRPFNFSHGTQFGVIAQEIEAILPELVHTDSDGIKSVDYIKMTPLLIEAIKELKTENDDLKARLERLEKLIEK